MAAKRFPPNRFGHHWGQFLAGGFLLVLPSNRSPKVRHFELGAWDKQIDGQTDGSQHCLMTP